MNQFKKLILKLKYSRILNGGWVVVGNNKPISICKCKTIFCMCDIYTIFKKSDIDFDVNDDESIDIKGDINVHSVNILVKFNKVYGSFSLLHDKTTSLKNCPVEVHGDFTSGRSELTSMIHAPKFVHGKFILRNSNIKTFDHLPICSSLDMAYNKIYCVDRTLPDSSRLDYNPIFDCKVTGTYIRNIYDSPFSKLISLLYEVFNRNGVTITYSEIIDRLNEFDVIVDTYTIDKLNLESLLRYYDLVLEFGKCPESETETSESMTSQERLKSQYDDTYRSTINRTTRQTDLIVKTNKKQFGMEYNKFDFSNIFFMYELRS